MGERHLCNNHLPVISHAPPPTPHLRSSLIGWAAPLQRCVGHKPSRRKPPTVALHTLRSIDIMGHGAIAPRDHASGFPRQWGDRVGAYRCTPSARIDRLKRINPRRSRGSEGAWRCAPTGFWGPRQVDQPWWSPAASGVGPIARSGLFGRSLGDRSGRRAARRCRVCGSIAAWDRHSRQ